MHPHSQALSRRQVIGQFRESLGMRKHPYPVRRRIALFDWPPTYLWTANYERNLENLLF